MHVLCTSRGQSAACENWFPPYLMWVPGIEFGFLGLVASFFNCYTHLPTPCESQSACGRVLPVLNGVLREPHECMISLCIVT